MIKKALILTGGKGTRLYSLNNNTIPKALMPLNESTTFLDYTIQFIASYGIYDICISVNHQKEKIIKYIKDKYLNSSFPTPIKISIQIEPEDVGTGGAMYLFAKENKGNFVALPVDYFYPNPPKDIFDEENQNNSIVWYVTNIVTEFTQPHVINNIYYDKETKKMMGYLSKATNEEKVFWNKEYIKGKPLERGSSIGMVVINGQKYSEFVQLYNFAFPFCLYKDVAPACIGTYGNVSLSYSILVKKIVINPIDMGLPERYSYCKQKYYETNNYSS